MTLEYRQSLTELNTILNYMDIHYVKRIPKRFIDFVTSNMDSEYEPSISQDKPINQQELKKHTKVLISILYRNFWCDNETKEILRLKDIIAEKKRREKYNNMYSVDMLFNRKKVEDSQVEKVEEVAQENTQLITVEKQKWYQKIFSKILSIFKINRK